MHLLQIFVESSPYWSLSAEKHDTYIEAIAELKIEVFTTASNCQKLWLKTTSSAAVVTMKRSERMLSWKFQYDRVVYIHG